MKEAHRRQLADVDDIEEPFFLLKDFFFLLKEEHNLSFKDKTIQLFWAFDHETKVAVTKNNFYKI